MSADEVEVESSDSLPDVSTPESPPAVESSSAPSADSSPASPLSAFRSMPGFEQASDDEIVSRLQTTMQREQQAYRALQQYQQIIPAASEYLSNRDSYQQWMQSRNQPQQAPAPAPKQDEPWWNPPKVRDAYRQFLVRDEQGREVISDNAPLEARHALSEYQAYRADFARKFLEDPQQALGPMIERVVADRAREIAESQISGLKEETFVQQVEAENRDWLYDQNGNVSREGLLAQKYIEDAKGMGINGAKARWDYATAMVERDLAIANLQNNPQQRSLPNPQAQPVPQQNPVHEPQPTAAQKNMDFLRAQATKSAPRRSQSTQDSRTPNKPMTFADRMIANLQKTGFSE